jgi:hypothetical protein
MEDTGRESGPSGRFAFDSLCYEKYIIFIDYRLGKFP